jgi:hypothetical protein
MLFSEIISVYSENYTKHKNYTLGKTQRLFMFKQIVHIVTTVL